jgi:hypothetical protein
MRWGGFEEENSGVINYFDYWRDDQPVDDPFFFDTT